MKNRVDVLAPSERISTPVTQALGWESVQAVIDRRLQDGRLGSDWATSRRCFALALIRYWFGDHPRTWPGHVRASIRAGVRQAISVLRYRPLGGRTA